MESKIFPTHTSVNQASRAPMIASLNRALASTIDLHWQTKQAHWNVKGPQFVALHELFDKLADALRLQADVLAERASALGGYAEGTVRLAASNTAIPELPPISTFKLCAKPNWDFGYSKITSTLEAQHA